MFVESDCWGLSPTFFSETRVQKLKRVILVYWWKKKKKTLQKYIVYGVFGFIYFSQIASGLVTRKLVPKSFLLGESFTIIIFAMLHGMWDFSSLTRDQTCVPCNPAVDMQSLNHWTPAILQWTCRVLTTGPPGNSLKSFFFFNHQPLSKYYITP